MNMNLVERPRLAITTAVAIIAAVAIVAALFPNSISIAEIPKRGNEIEDLYGRTFDAVKATDGGQPYQLTDDLFFSLTFSLLDRVGVAVFGTPCGELYGSYRLDDGRFDWRGKPPTFVFECSGAQQVHIDWLEAFLYERPTWRLDGNTLELGSAFGTMTLTDSGEGSKPTDILGERVRTGRWEAIDERDKARFRANTSLSLSFDRDGTLRAKLGCESVVVPTEVRTGWFRITEALRPERTTDCSRSMARQKTAWLWDLLDQPVQWQVLYGQSLVLKPSQPDQRPLVLSRVDEEKEWRTDPGLLAGKTLFGGPNSPFVNNLDGYGGILIEVADNGEFTATAGCEQPSIHGRFRTGWVQYGDDLEWTLSACEDVEAEQWLADFLAHEPSWRTGREGELILWGAGYSIDFAETGDYEETSGEPRPSDDGGN